MLFRSRIGQNDVELLSRYFQPLFNGDDLLRVPNFNAIVRTLISGVPTQPFSMATIPALGKPNQQLLLALKQLSAAKFGRPKAQVEKEIFERLATQEPPKRPFSSTPGMPASADQINKPTTPQGALPPASSTAKKPSSSFLDDWLAKRRQPASTTGSGAPQSPQIASAPQQSSRPQTTAPAKPVSPQPPQITPHEGTIMSATPLAAPSESQVQESQETRNISSSTIENEEVAGIAQELKQSLDKTTSVPELPIEESKPDRKTEAVVSLNDDTSMEPSLDEDTIYIDRDGNLRSKADDEAS